mmetsp:Transcript_8882/g.14549  ORF Transcript_8882/g.14549 Transcript_8882/m.14549 type:complete len:317 (+) Transcript_8882:124-1074(+)
MKTEARPIEPLNIPDVDRLRSLGVPTGVTIKPKERSAVTVFAINAFSGGVAGVTECFCMYPLDIIKTRMMISTSGTSFGMTVMELYHAQGALGFYRGMASPLLAEFPKRAVKFAFAEHLKKLTSKVLSNDWAASAAGGLAGVIEAVVLTPFELIKVRLQDKSNVSLYSGTNDALVKIARAEGVSNLYKGYESTAWRQGVWNGVYFGVIPLVNRALQSPDSQNSKLQKFCAGTIAGALATVANTPFDVVKSRIQAQAPGSGPPKYSWTLPGIGIVFREGGLKALYRGFGPKILRLGPGGGIMFIVFDFLQGTLSAKL